MTILVVILIVATVAVVWVSRKTSPSDGGSRKHRGGCHGA
jgi:hypothetical protein